ncbi:MAG: Trm112 family protein [Pseudohongiellaceae bacterium]
MLDKKLLAMLVCPLCKSSLHYDAAAGELICWPDSLAYPVRDGIPVMLDTEARVLTPEEKASRKPT